MPAAVPASWAPAAALAASQRYLALHLHRRLLLLLLLLHRPADLRHCSAQLRRPPAFVAAWRQQESRLFVPSLACAASLLVLPVRQGGGRGHRSGAQRSRKERLGSHRKQPVPTSGVRWVWLDGWDGCACTHLHPRLGGFEGWRDACVVRLEINAEGRWLAMSLLRFFSSKVISLRSTRRGLPASRL